MNIKVKIPEKIKMTITPGQKVDFSTPLGQIEKNKLRSIPLAQILGFEPKHIFHYLKRVIGESIEKNEMLAEYKTLFNTKKYFSEISGILRQIKHDTGIISIEENQKDSSDLNCYFCGEIDGIYDGFLELKVNEAHTTPIKSLSKYFGAAIYYMNQQTSYTDDDIKNFCVFASNISSIDAIKLETLGALGFVTKTEIPAKTSVPQIVLSKEEDFEYISKHAFPYLIIGHEPLTVLFYQ